ncbi:MAG: PaaI family thioesterase [Alcaligenaceae bacterium]|nr:PaaI family thioesterase [Alcaligenaceae bacterium]
MSESSELAGYHFVDRNSNFSDLTGPYYMKKEPGKEVSLGLKLEKKHMNSLGRAHGGILMTLADNALGDAVEALFDEPASLVTVSMNTEFVGAAMEGDWVVSEARILKRQGRLLFVDCVLRVEQRVVLHASAVMARVKSA